MSYNVGSAYLQIVPSFAGVAETISQRTAEWGTSGSQSFSRTFNEGVKRGTSDAEIGPSDASSAQRGSSAAGKFADSFRERLEAALKALPEINLDADPSEAEAKIAEIRWQLEELSGQRIGVDVDEATALAQLDRLKAELDEIGARSPSVRVQVDTAAASAELAAFKAEVDALDSDGGGGFSGLSGALEGIDAGSVAAGAGIAALGAIAIPIGAALVASFAGVATVFGALAGAAGVLYLGFSGVSNAVGLLGQQQTAQAKSGASSVSSMNQQAAAAQQLTQAERNLKQTRETADNAAITAAENVKNARQSLADTETQAAQKSAQASATVKQAEATLTQTVQQSATAQQALNSAREQAARDLETYANSAVDANLNLQQSRIDLVNAQAQQQTDQNTPGVSAEQLQQDALNVAKAQQAIVEAQESLANATADNNKAQKEGVNGAPGVVTAEQQVLQARNAQKTAVQQLSAAEKAQTQQSKANAESIAQAQQKVSDALRAQVQQQRQSAVAIANAEDGVSSAMRAVQTASQGVGTSGASSLASIDAQLAKVNPATLQLAEFVRGTLAPAFDKLKNAAAAGLLPGIEAGLKNLAPLAGPLTSFIGSLAGTMGDLFKQASKALTDPFWTQFFGWVGKEAGPTLSTFVHILENLGKGFAGLLEAFTPITNAIGRGLLDLTKGFADFGAKAGSPNSPFQSFLDYVKQVGPQVAATLAVVAGAIGHIIVAAAPIGPVVLSVIKGFASAIRSIPTGVLTGVIAAFVAWRVALLAWTVAGSAWDVVQAVSNGLLAVWDALMAADPIVLVIGAIVLALVAAATLIVKNWNTITGAFSDAWDWITRFISQHWVLLLGLLTGPIGLAVGEIIKHWSTIEGAFSDGWDWVKSTFGKLWAGAEDIITTPITTAFDAIRSAWTAVKQFLTTEFTNFKTTVGKLWGDITGAASSAWGGITKFVSGIWTKVEQAFADAVNFVTQKIMNPLIDALNSALGIFGVNIGDIAPIKIGGGGSTSSSSQEPAGGKHSTGGTAPGYAPGRDSLWARVSPGEGFIVPEAVRGLGGPSAIQAINATFSDRVGGAPRFGLGGVLGSVGNFFGGVAGDVVHGAGDAIHLVRQGAADAAVAALSAAEAPIKALVNAGPSEFAKQLAGGVFNHVNELVKSFIAGHASAAAGGSIAAPSGASPLAVWKALRSAGWSPVATAGMMGNIQTESADTFSPFIVEGGGYSTNPASAGAGGYGLVQWTPGAKLIPLLNGAAPSVFSEVSALTSELLHSSVGPLLRSARSASDAAEIFLTQFERPLNPDQPQRLTQAEAFFKEYGSKYDAGGWLPPGITAAINMTGKPEPIFTQAQAQALAGAATGGNGGDTKVFINGKGVALEDLIDVRIEKHDRATSKIVMRDLPGRGGARGNTNR